MGFKKYKGPDKYHFRFYKKSIFHPFIVVAVTEEKSQDGKIYISGYMMTTSIVRALDKPSTYHRLKVNPNPSDNKVSFVNRFRVSDVPSSCFTKPHPTWHLSKEDEKLIDAFEKRFFKKQSK